MIVDCEVAGMRHEWYPDGAGNSCYHCEAFEVPDVESEDW